MNPGPVGQRRPGDHDGADEIGTHAGSHHRVPTRLTVAHDEGFAVSLGMELAHLLDEHGVGAGDVLDGLTIHRLGREAYEIDRMAGLEGVADLADRLEAADAMPLAGARIDHDHRSFAIVDLGALRRNDAHQRVVDRAGQLLAAQHELEVEDQDRIDRPRRDLRLLIPTPSQDVHENDRPLPEVACVLGRRIRCHPAEAGRQSLG
jgi:hypothetical protein